MALTLKTVAGLSTRQIAAAFLVSEATMSQRLLRAKNKIVHSGIGFAPPEPHRVAERTAGVLAVVYLVFNEAYVSSAGSADDPVLAREAIELAALGDQAAPAGSRGRRTASRCCSCSTRDGLRGWIGSATWCRWRTRTAACGIGT